VHDKYVANVPDFFSRPYALPQDLLVDIGFGLVIGEAVAWAKRFNRSMLYMYMFGSECSRQLILQASHLNITASM
jgi:hypothetical protein